MTLALPRLLREFLSTENSEPCTLKMGAKVSAFGPINTLSINQRYLLTYGYVNDMVRSHQLCNSIPLEIHTIIWSYNECCDTWNKKYLNKEEIELTGNRIKCLHYNWSQYDDGMCTTMYGNASLSSGSHTWMIRIVRRPKTSNYGFFYEQPFVGFIKDDPYILQKFRSSYDWDDNGYSYRCGDGCVGYNGNYHVVQMCKKNNDILCITLNLDERKIYLSINGGDDFVPEPFKHIKKGKYRFVVTMYKAKGTIIELL